MARGALRGAGTAVLSLIVLQGLVSRGGSGRVASLLNDVNGLVVRVFDPNVPAIPDHRAGATSSIPLGGYPTTASTDNRATVRTPILGQWAAQ